jgi:signal transduction histidine kinase
VVAEPISLTAMFEELVQQTRDEIEARPVTVSWQVDADADSMNSDRRKMTQALGGLLSNAAKFTEKGRINVMARRLGDNTVEITVSDTGIGIASSDLALAFDDFRQIDGSFTRRYGGLGVGLPLVRELVALLGGRMEVDSELGRGTTVRLVVPRAVTGKSLQIERRKDRPPAEAEAEASEPLRSVG